MADRLWQDLDRSLAVAGVILVLGLWSFFGRSPVTPTLTEPVAPNNIARALAIEDARSKGETTYSYTTNFIPGIGTITDPQQYKDNLLNNIKDYKPTKP